MAKSAAVQMRKTANPCPGESRAGAALPECSGPGGGGQIGMEVLAGAAWDPRLQRGDHQREADNPGDSRSAVPTDGTDGQGEQPKPSQIAAAARHHLEHRGIAWGVRMSG